MSAMAMHERPLRSEPEEAQAMPAALLHATALRVKGVVDLGAAEIRLAAMSALKMLLLVVLAGASLVIAWGLLVACLLFVSAQLEIPWAYAALALLVIHAAAAYELWAATLRLSARLALPRLRATLFNPSSDHATSSHAQPALAREP